MVLKEILIFRALQLGDLMCSVPAIRALKTAFPQARLTLLGMPWAESFTRRYQRLFSGFMPFPGFPGLPEQEFKADRFLHFLSAVRQHKPDLLIQLHGNGSIVNPLMKLMSDGPLAGYFQPGAWCPDTRLFMPYPEGIPEIRRHLKLMQFLNIPPAGEELDFPLSLEEESEYRQLSSDFGLEPGNYVCIHAGARDVKRRWKPENFGQVAAFLSGKGYTPVLTGTPAEKHAAAQVAAHLSGAAIDLTGKTSLGALAALIRDAALLVSNDTGVSHIAAAMKTPSVVIFLTSEPARWAPLDRALHRMVLPEASGDVARVLTLAEEALSSKKEKINI